MGYRGANALFKTYTRFVQKERIMGINATDKKAEKSLSMAYKSEEESIHVFEKLKEQINNFVLKDKLNFLINDEKKHQKVLHELFRNMYHGKELPISHDSRIPWMAIAIQEEISVCDLWGLTLGVKRNSVRYYDYLSKEFEDGRAREIFQYLAAMEHGHYFMLEGEYQLCLRDVMYYEHEDFQYRQIHFGP
jgi:rubrerythrin